MLQCFDPASRMTLGEAIQAMRVVEEQKSDLSAKLSSEMKQAFEYHDAVHVLFSCGTTLQDEISAHVWMFFGTTAKISEMHHAVANQEHRHVLSGIGHLKLLGVWIRCLPNIVSIIVKCSKMKRWAALEELATLKEQPLCDIRREHGIVV